MFIVTIAIYIQLLQCCDYNFIYINEKDHMQSDRLLNLQGLRTAQNHKTKITSRRLHQEDHIKKVI